MTADDTRTLRLLVETRRMAEDEALEALGRANKVADAASALVRTAQNEVDVAVKLLDNARSDFESARRKPVAAATYQTSYAEEMRLDSELLGKKSALLEATRRHAVVTAAVEAARQVHADASAQRRAAEKLCQSRLRDTARARQLADEEDADLVGLRRYLDTQSK